MRAMTRSILVLVQLALAGCASSPVSTQSPSSSTAASATELASTIPTASPSTSSSEAATLEQSQSPQPPPSDPAAYVQGTPYAPVINPADFTASVDNPYLPWTVGATWTYRGGDERNVVTVLPDKHTVLGVATRVVHDQVFTGSELTEDTFDWYAQDRAGNVWYFGEKTEELERGKVTSREGSWEAGVEGAQPGIVMLANPTVGGAYRQEYKKGEAEDLARVHELGAHVTVKAGTYDDVLVTEEWTPLEPTILEHKSYARGVGVVLEEVIKGAKEHNELVSMTMP